MPNSYTSSSEGFFTNANHVIVTGGQFTNHINSLKPKDGFEILQGYVAPAAFHNSKQRLNPPRCHENTREAILEELFDWIVGNISQDKWIAWLNGAAGAGKSAICQSMAELCIQRGIKVASFFFFRTDDTRNRIDPLIATLVYQIIQLFPGMRDYILKIIEINPLIFEQTLETQLDVLIVQTLRPLQLFSPDWQLLFIIDGVDECKGHEAQMSLIRVFSKVLLAKHLPIIVLVGSRYENQLQMAFDSRTMTEILIRFPLDDHYEPDEDIRRFLNDSFDNIRQTHPFRSRLKPDWPEENHVQEIIQKSSGQFVYASVVIKFLSAPSSNPSVQLEIIRGLRPSGRSTPFAELDALYRHIFSQVDDLPNALNLLAYTIFTRQRPKGLRDLLSLLDLEEDDLQIILAPLTSVLICDLETQKISFRHASLPDFLRDEKRSEKYCIRALPTHLSILLLNQIASGKFTDVDNDEHNVDLPELLENADITVDLYASLSAYQPFQQDSAFTLAFYASRLLNSIKKIDFSDNGKLYDDMLHRIVRFLEAEYPVGGALSLVRIEHNVSHILEEIALSEEPLVHTAIQRWTDAAEIMD